MLRLWALLGLAFVMLAAPAGAIGAAPSVTTVPSTHADAAAVDAGGRASKPAAEPCVQKRDDRVRITAHELGAMELELDDDDSRSDVAALPTAVLPALEPVRLARVPEDAEGEPGRSQVAGALARGPPVAC